MKKKAKTLAVWVALVVLVLIFLQFGRPEKPSHFEEFDTFLSHVESGQVTHVRVQDNRIIVYLDHSDTPYVTMGSIDPELTIRMLLVGY